MVAKGIDKSTFWAPAVTFSKPSYMAAIHVGHLRHPFQIDEHGEKKYTSIILPTSINQPSLEHQHMPVS
jgi:hypothetical protein